MHYRHFVQCLVTGRTTCCTHWASAKKAEPRFELRVYLDRQGYLSLTARGLLTGLIVKQDNRYSAELIPMEERTLTMQELEITMTNEAECCSYHGVKGEDCIALQKILRMQWGCTRAILFFGLL